MPRVVVRCMVCGESVNVDLSHLLPCSRLFDLVARSHGWQTTCLTPPGADGPRLFICCPECIPWAYAPVGDTLGRLRPEAYHLMVEDGIKGAKDQ